MPKTNDISVILAASGKGVRLYSESLEICKPLFFYQTKPIIIHLIDQYKQFSDDIIVSISNDEKGNFLRSYLLDYYDNPKFLSFYIQHKQSGTNNIVFDCLKLIKNKKVLVSWSDFIINSDITKYLNEDVFFTADITCRFSYKENKIIKETNNPGFLGLYFLSNIADINLDKEDFIENYLNKSIKSQNINITNLGTIEELIKNQAFQSYSNRSFNQLEFNENTVIKTAITDYGKKLQAIEANWYQNVPNTVEKYIPKFQYFPESNQLVLERIKGKPISQISNEELGRDFWRKKLPKLLEDLHQPSSIPVNKEDCLSVYVEKPKERLKETQRTIDAWFGGDYRINGVDYKDWRFPEWQNKWYPKEFSFLHGDLNFDNLMMKDNGELALIDPRGSFGSTINYGDCCYDISKIWYAISGYDKINTGDFLLGKTNQGTILVHQKRKWSLDIEYFWKWCQERYSVDEEKLDYMVKGIWLSLTGYVKNKPLSVVAAYCKGIMND